MGFHRRVKQEKGQATVEFVLAAPFIFAILYAIVQFGIVYFNYLHVTDAARAGARQAVVTHNPGLARSAAVASATGLSGFTSTNVSVSGTLAPDGTLAPGSDVTVSARYPYSINLLGVVVKSGDLTSSTTERVE
jgi:Flp pilus assembly protein TadG